MREIPLTKGFVALVDDEDYIDLSRFDWCWSNGYAVRSGFTPAGVRTTVRMHRQILGLRPGDGVVVDHRNERKLDNRRANLRVGNTSQNISNRSLTPANSSGLKGACWDKSRGLWYSSIMVNRKSRYLGRFPTAEAAHSAYCMAAKELHGEFANYGKRAA